MFSTVAAPWVLSNGAVAVNGFARSGIASFSPAGIGTAAGTYNGSATQTVAVAIPGTYSLTFYAATQAAGPYSLVASINGITLINTTVNSTRYQLFTATAVLAAGLATLAVSGASAGAPNNTALFLDDFSLIMAAAQNLTLTPSLAALALTQNQLGAALGLTNAFNSANLGFTAAPNGVAGAFVTALNNTPAANIPAVLDSLTGEGITGAQNTAFTASRLFTSSIADQILLFGGAPNSVIVPTTPSTAPLAYSAVQALPTPIRVRDPMLARPLYSWRAWGSGYGASQRINANATVLGNAQQSIGIGGGSVGVDYTWAPGMLSGIALGGSDGSFNVGARQTSGSTTGGHAAFFTLAEFGPNLCRVDQQRLGVRQSHHPHRRRLRRPQLRDFAR